MKIVVVASLAFSLVNFRGQLLADMLACGHEVIACAPEADEAVTAQLAEMSVAYRPMPMARAGLNPLADLWTLIWLMRLFFKERPGLVLAYTQKPIIYSGLAARIVGRCRYFAMVSGLGHAFGDEGERLLRFLVAILYRFALARAEAVFVFNADDRGEMLRHRMIRATTPVVRVPGSGVDLGHYAVAPLSKGPLRFLMVARLLRSKGLFEYVEAARRLRQRYPEIQFALLGPLDPNPAGISLSQVQAWQEEATITYLGEVRDVRPHLAACSVFVLPSWYREGLPRSILEAMATGRAIITTDMPGCRECVEPGENGYIIPPRNLDALEAAMLRLIEDPDIVAGMGKRSRAMVVDRFSVERVNDTLLEIMRLRNFECATEPRADYRNLALSAAVE